MSATWVRIAAHARPLSRGGGQIKRCNWAFCGSMGGLKGDEVACFVTPANVFRKSIFDSIKI